MCIHIIHKTWNKVKRVAIFMTYTLFFGLDSIESTTYGYFWPSLSSIYAYVDQKSERKKEKNCYSSKENY